MLVTHILQPAGHAALSPVASDAAQSASAIATQFNADALLRDAFALVVRIVELIYAASDSWTYWLLLVVAGAACACALSVRSGASLRTDGAALVLVGCVLALAAVGAYAAYGIPAASSAPVMLAFGTVCAMLGAAVLGNPPQPPSPFEASRVAVAHPTAVRAKRPERSVAAQPTIARKG